MPTDQPADPTRAKESAQKLPSRDAAHPAYTGPESSVRCIILSCSCVDPFEHKLLLIHWPSTIPVHASRAGKAHARTFAGSLRYHHEFVGLAGCMHNLYEYPRREGQLQKCMCE